MSQLLNILISTATVVFHWCDVTSVVSSFHTPDNCTTEVYVFKQEVSVDDAYKQSSDASLVFKHTYVRVQALKVMEMCNFILI